MFCSHCGKTIELGVRFCPHCGASVGQPVPGNQAPPVQPQPFYTPYPVAGGKQKTTALILCILGFFVLGGLHRFYVGKIGTGILWFLTGGLFYIGTIVDLVAICDNSFTDSNGYPMVP